MIRIHKLFLIVCLAVVSANAHAQPYADEIRAFKKQDSISPPPLHSILFVGSSSFRMWKDVNEYFPGYTIINRGFGGSTLPDVIRYEKDIIFPYQPRQIVIYCGENDVAYSDTISAEMVLQRFQQLYTDIRKQLPEVPVVFVSLKPSPSRWQMKERMMRANELIREFLKTENNNQFVNVWQQMLTPDGKPNEALFLADNLHMNEKGYAIWKKIIEPYLAK
jgi:lysophospholipase L1-like esterase